MVEYHVEHKLDVVLFRFLDQSIDILHGAEHGIDGKVIRDVVSIVVHRGSEKGCDPEVIYSQILQIIQFLPDSVDISDPVPV